ncbi:MAG: anthranilate phosphoribosyltransferase [Gammaproteobacteria bacterium]|nr:anthranilate phosphoribosyltransferase [Gammaproteobacteria bacterium]
MSSEVPETTTHNEASNGAAAAGDGALMRSIIQRIATGPELSKDITRDEARRGMRAVLDGAVDPVRAAVFLIALRMKRETDEENLGILDAVRETTETVTAPVDEVVDLSDPYNGFNRNLPVSAFLPAVLAACGVPAISHGVESMGPKFGATHHRVLAASGARVDATTREACRRLADPDVGWAYCDQSVFNPGLHALAELRSLIVKRPALATVEVMAGPVRGRRRTHVVTGYVHKPYALIYTMLARSAGFDSALIVRGIEGGIIPSLRQGAKVWSYHDGGDAYDTDISPETLGIEQTVRAVPLPEGIEGYRRKSDETGAEVDGVAIAEAAARVGLDALDGAPGPARDSLVYGAALILRHVGRTERLDEGAALVRAALDDGRARAHFDHR